MTTKNIQNVVAERVEKFFELQEKNTYLVRKGKIDPNRADELERNYLTQLVKEVEAGERAKHEEAIDWIDGVVRQVAFDSETGKIWQHWLDEGKRILQALTPPTSDVTEK